MFVIMTPRADGKYYDFLSTLDASGAPPTWTNDINKSKKFDTKENAEQAMNLLQKSQSSNENQILPI
jgi:hypothetical protein